MSKKTVKVADLLEYLNHQLQSEYVDDIAKSAFRSVAESVLLSTDNYHGYSHLNDHKDNSVHYVPNHNLSQDYTKASRKRQANDGFRSLGEI